MDFRLWLESQQMPTLYHGSPKKQTTLQAGSMLTEDPAWAAGYTTRTDWDDNRMSEYFSGVIHVVKPNFQNPHTAPMRPMAGAVHSAEMELIEMAKKLGHTGGGLNKAAAIVHEETGYDAILANFRGKIVGAITLIPLPVEDYIDPAGVVRKHKDNPAIENLLKALDNPRSKYPIDS